jgi:hypothetical protein
VSVGLIADFLEDCPEDVAAAIEWESGDDGDEAGCFLLARGWD